MSLPWMRPYRRTRKAMTEKSYRDAIRDAMMEEMDRDPNVLIMGEDIGVYEGTFRITAGMLKKYGPKRVIDTPISESAIIGAAPPPSPASPTISTGAPSRRSWTTVRRHTPPSCSSISRFRGTWTPPRYKPYYVAPAKAGAQFS